MRDKGRGEQSGRLEKSGVSDIGKGRKMAWEGRNIQGRKRTKGAVNMLK